jgi:DNA-binding transcriptional regulator YiaG
MTPADLAAIIEKLGLTQAGLASLVGTKNPRTVRRWLDGTTPIPAKVEIILGGLKSKHAVSREVHND